MNYFRIILPVAAGAFAATYFYQRDKRILRENLTGRTFVIVGASSGFGRGVAVKLGSYNANVVLAARRTDLLEEVAREVRQAGGNAHVVTMDISNRDDMFRLAEETQRQFGDVDVWINNSGVGIIGKFWEVPLDDQERLLDVNLKGFLYGSHIALKIFINQGHGTLINIGSTDSEVPMAFHAIYSASKAGVRSLGKAINQELRLSGFSDIKVVTIEPWGVDTPWWGHAANYSGGTPRMASIDPPGKVINAILRAAARRPAELPVGWKARASYISHHLFPHMTEKRSADINHQYQYVDAPPALNTSGSLYEPMETGRGVSDGVRARIREEKRQQQNGENDRYRK